MNKGMIGGIGFVAGATAGYLYRKFGVKPIVRLDWCENRPRYLTNPWKVYFDNYFDAQKAKSDLEFKERLNGFVSTYDWASTAALYNGSLDTAFSSAKGGYFNSVNFGWKSIETLRVRKNLKNKKWRLEIATHPEFNYSRQPGSTPYYSYSSGTMDCSGGSKMEKKD